MHDTSNAWIWSFGYPRELKYDLGAIIRSIEMNPGADFSLSIDCPTHFKEDHSGSINITSDCNSDDTLYD